MSDLVGNPDDRFSHNEAHMFVAERQCVLMLYFSKINLLCAYWDICGTVVKYEPRCEKTGLRGFRPGPTQTRLYNHTRWLEA